MAAIRLLLSCIVVTLAVGMANAQDSSAPPRQPLRVGVYISPPFVMKEGGRYTGMAIELWEALAAKLKLPFDYEEVATVGDLIEATSSGKLDVAVSNMSITEARIERMDFTHPWYDAGLRLMVNDNHATSFSDVFAGLRDAGFLRTYAMLAGIIVAATFLLTTFDRRFNSEFPNRWRDGLADNFYHVMSVATSGRAPARKNPFGWVGTMISALWLVSGVAVLAYVTSTVTSVMTAISLSHIVSSTSDLPGRTAGVIAGSVAETFAHDSRIAYNSFDNIDQAVASLLENNIDAIIGDAPVLEYYAHTHPGNTLTVVGATFEPDKYGFGLPLRSDLTKPLTVAIVAAHENDTLENLRLKYFADTP